MCAMPRNLLNASLNVLSPFAFHALQLKKNRGLQSSGEFVESDDRSTSDAVHDAVRNFRTLEWGAFGNDSALCSSQLSWKYKKCEFINKLKIENKNLTDIEKDFA